MTSFATTSDGSLAACLWVAVRVLVLVGWLLGGTAALAVVAHDRGYISASVMEYVLVGAFGGFIAHAIGIASAGARCVRRRGGTVTPGGIAMADDPEPGPRQR